MALQQLFGVRFEKWKLQHFRAMNVRNLEDACATLQEFVDHADEAWREAIGELLAGGIKNPEATGQEIRLLHQALEKELQWIESAVVAAQNSGYEVKGAHQLGQARQKIQSCKAKLEANWPFIDRKAVAESRAQIERGEFQPIEGLLSESERLSHAGILPKAE